MQRIPECKICSWTYDSKTHVPITLNCGHTFCEVCVANILLHGVLKCSLCRDTCLASQFRKRRNYEILDQLERMEVVCDMCQHTPSFQVCTVCIVFTCLACGSSHICAHKATKELTEVNLGYFLVQRIAEGQTLDPGPTLPSDVLMNKTSAELVQILRDLNERARSVCPCVRHSTTPASVVDLVSFTPYCSKCAGLASKPYDLIGSSSLDALNELFYTTMQSIDSVCIPPLMQRTHTRLDTLLTALRQLTAGQAFVPYCPICRGRLDKCEVYRYPCKAVHLVCESCRPQSLQVTCAYDQQTYRRQGVAPLEFSLTELYTSSPKCPLCINGEDLLEVLCGHSLCQQCLESTEVCPMCGVRVGTASVEDSFVVKLRRLRCCECSEEAVWIAAETLAVYCATCASYPCFTLTPLPGDLSIVFHAILSQLLTNLTASELSLPTYQDKVLELRDKICHAEVTPELSGLLAQYPRVNICELATLVHYLKTDCFDCDNQAPQSPGWRIPHVVQEGCQVAMRFKSLLPPQNYQLEAKLPNRRPWIVSTERQQIEVVGLSVLEQVQLLGIVMAASYLDGPAVLEYFELRTGQAPQDACMVLDESSELLMRDCENRDLSLPGRSKALMFRRPFELSKGQHFLIKFKLGGELFYRGNRFDIGEEDLGVFRLVAVRVLSRDFIDGQNHLTGPLLGFIYK